MNQIMKIKCPQCNHDIEINPARELGKISAKNRKGDSKKMSELAKKGWIKRKKPDYKMPWFPDPLGDLAKLTIIKPIVAESPCDESVVRS